MASGDFSVRNTASASIWGANAHIELEMREAFVRERVDSAGFLHEDKDRGLVGRSHSELLESARTDRLREGSSGRTWHEAV